MVLDRGPTILLELGGAVDLLTTGLNRRDVAVKARCLQLSVKNMPRDAQRAEDRRIALDEAVTVAVRVLADQVKDRPRRGTGRSNIPRYSGEPWSVRVS